MTGKCVDEQNCFCTLASVEPFLLFSSKPDKAHDCYSTVLSSTKFAVKALKRLPYENYQFVIKGLVESLFFHIK